MDYYLFFVIFSALFCFFAINLKMFFYYEEEDAIPGKELPMKFMILWSWTFAYFMVFMLPVDVQDTR